LASEVLAGDTQALDELIIVALRRDDALDRPIGPAWLNEMGRDATALGGMGWLVLATGGVAGFLVLVDKPKMAIFLVTSTISGFVLSLILKTSFDRPRPDIVSHLSYVYTSSFPSGHSMLAAVVYLTLGGLVAEVVERPLLKIYVIFIALTITIIVGVSRVYLGVHYPTDVLAGWIAGLVWATICSLLGRWLQWFGRVETSEVE
jgi:undecaprenyl-diphosphatase